MWFVQETTICVALSLTATNLLVIFGCLLYFEIRNLAARKNALPPSINVPSVMYKTRVESVNFPWIKWFLGTLLSSVGLFWTLLFLECSLRIKIFLLIPMLGLLSYWFEDSMSVDFVRLQFHSYYFHFISYTLVRSHSLNAQFVPPKKIWTNKFSRINRIKILYLC